MTEIGKTHLLCIVGSTAYGLNKPSSDIDRFGVFERDINELIGLKAPEETYSQNNPDVTYHELRKYLGLLLKSNPTVLETLFLSADLYEIKTYEAEELIANRSWFPSKTLVRNAYFGYSTQQMKDLQRRGGTFSPDLNKRTEKHAKHLYRLLLQGLDLWQTGEIQVRVADPERIHDFGKQVLREAEKNEYKTAFAMMANYENYFDATKTVLPDEPNYDAVNDWLIKTRRDNDK